MNVKFRRLLASAIDIALLMIVAEIESIIYITILQLDKYYFICCILFYTPLLLILSSKDILFGYESIGKKLLKIHIYDGNGERVTDKKVLFKRVIVSLFNIYVAAYPIMVLMDNKSFGDKKMNTVVK